MRYIEPPSPEQGNKRLRTFFAFTPFRVDKETRWLEWVTVREEYKCGYGGCWWCVLEFVDDKKELLRAYPIEPTGESTL